MIDNAVKFTADFDKEVKVSLVRKGNEACLFEVKDQGIGLKEADMEKIFTIFHRIEKRDSYTHGNGLLHIMVKYVFIVMARVKEVFLKLHYLCN